MASDLSVSPSANGSGGTPHADSDASLRQCSVNEGRVNDRRQGGNGADSPIVQHDRSANSQRQRPEETFADKLLRRAIESGDEQLEDDQFRTEYPLLANLLTQRQYGKDKPRTPSDLVLGVANGLFVVTLHEHDTHLQKTVLCATWSCVAQALELALRGGEPPWREYKSKRNPAGLKKFKEKL